jgi:hypothetical protein
VVEAAEVPPAPEPQATDRIEPPRGLEPMAEPAPVEPPALSGAGRPINVTAVVLTVICAAVALGLIAYLLSELTGG